MSQAPILFIFLSYILHLIFPFIVLYFTYYIYILYCTFHYFELLHYFIPCVLLLLVWFFFSYFLSIVGGSLRFKNFYIFYFIFSFIVLYFTYFYILLHYIFCFLLSTILNFCNISYLTFSFYLRDFLFFLSYFLSILGGRISIYFIFSYCIIFYLLSYFTFYYFELLHYFTSTFSFYLWFFFHTDFFEALLEGAKDLISLPTSVSM